MTERELIKLLAHVELARRNFYYFCTLLFPTIYKKDRLYLKEICDKYIIVYILY